MIFSAFLGIPEGFLKPEQWLAVLGGAALGGFLFGLLAQSLCRAMTKKKLPPIPTTVVRIVGGVIVGVLTAMWMWQGGGWGPGPKGDGDKNGNGDKQEANSQTKPPNPPPQQEKPQEKHEEPPPADKPPIPPQNVLTLQALTNDELRAMPGAGDQAVKDGREYKVAGDDDSKDLRTLPQMLDFIQKRLTQDPPLLRVVILTPKGVSPDVTAPRVMQLRDGIRKIGPKLLDEPSDH